MSVKEHYDNHLGNFYSWMTGDFETRVKECEQFFADHYIQSSSKAVALDLGCGHGIQSVALARIGFKVVSVDFNKKLLLELYGNKQSLPVLIIENDILSYLNSCKDVTPNLIVCMGDTLSHFESFGLLDELFSRCYALSEPCGKLVLSFRDYSVPLKGCDRFIPVKSDEQKILTCCLEYQDATVTVTDILYEKQSGKWNQKISSYSKLRLTEEIVTKSLEKSGYSILMRKTIKGLVHIIATKQS